MIWKSGILSRKHRNTEAKACRSEGIQRLRHIKVQTHRSIEIQKHRNTEAWIYGSVEILEAGRKVCG